jgi:hypothetical protein
MLYLSEKRTSLLPKHLIERPNILKFKNLMTSERKPILQKLCKFIRYITHCSLFGVVVQTFRCRYISHCSLFGDVVQTF